MTVLELATGLAGTLLLLGPPVHAAFRLAIRMLPAAPASVLVSAACCLGASLLTLEFHLLARAGCFRLVPAIAAGLLVAWLVGRWEDRNPRPGSGTGAELVAQVRAAATYLDRSPCRGLALGMGSLVVLGALRGAIGPPGGWDTLTYHLPKAAIWVQTGSTALFEAPGEWSYYRLMQGGGEVFWAFAMLPFGSDALANLVNLPALVWLYAATYALARELGTSPGMAHLGTLAVVSQPVLMSTLVTAYTEILLAAAALAGIGFLLRFQREPAAAEAVLAGAAFGLGAGIKLTGAIPALSAAGGLAAVSLLAPRPRAPLAGAAGLALLVALAVAGPWYVDLLAATGSPTYPGRLRLLGHDLRPGAAALEEMMAGIDPLIQAKRAKGLTGLDVAVKYLETTHSRPGPAGLLALWGILCGGVRMLRRGEGRRLLPLLAVIAAVAAMFQSDEMRVVRIWWNLSSGRFLSVPLALGFLLGAYAADDPGPVSRILRWSLAAAVALHLLCSLPPGWGAPPVDPPTFLASAGAMALLGSRGGRSRGGALPMAGTVLASLAILASLALLSLRDAYRYPLFRNTWEMHPIPWKAPETWQLLDRPATPLRIAIAEGPCLIEHHWMVFPLMGRRLQNRISYVPTTRDGSLGDGSYRSLATLEHDVQAWLGRLAEQEIDVLVCIWEGGRAEAWARSLPGIFRPIPGADRPTFEVDRARIRARPAPTPPGEVR